MNIVEFKTELWAIMYQVKSDIKKFVEKILQTEGLTMIQGYILFRLSESTITNISSLSKEFELNQGNVSTMCKQMEKAGLISRSRNAEDERIVNLSLTEQGKQTLERLHAYINKFDSKLEKMPKDKLEVILCGMNEFSKMLKTFMKEGI